MNNVFAGSTGRLMVVAAWALGAGDLNFPSQTGKKIGDRFLIAAVEDPLAYSPGGDEAGALKYAEVRGDSRLRKAGAFEFASANTWL